MVAGGPEISVKHGMKKSILEFWIFLVGPQTGFKDMLKFGSMGVPDTIFRHIFWKKSGRLFKS